MLLAVGMPT
ncbi:hypothetical protein LINPERPRIM_LOCUS13232 [Linum perenne]